MRDAALFVLLIAGTVGAALAQQATSPAPATPPPSATGDLGSGRDLGTGGGVTAGTGSTGGAVATNNGTNNGSRSAIDSIGGTGVTGDTGPDRDLGTGGTGTLRPGERLGTGGGVTGDAQAPTAIDDPAFLRLDANRNGTIDRSEAELDTALANDFAFADANRDGSVSLNEFQAMRRPP
jgi:hypothetical protein